MEMPLAWFYFRNLIKSFKISNTDEVGLYTTETDYFVRLLTRCTKNIELLESAESLNTHLDKIIFYKRLSKQVQLDSLFLNKVLTNIERVLTIIIIEQLEVHDLYQIINLLESNNNIEYVYKKEKSKHFGIVIQIVINKKNIRGEK